MFELHKANGKGVHPLGLLKINFNHVTKNFRYPDLYTYIDLATSLGLSTIALHLCVFTTSAATGVGT